mmetsp:Transcript_1220/g.1313  ORF Transcript_1220/g.1313 Transcript_1220/m.1313 type:complete len:134 (+) Transcript_1220:338-739(+)
MMVPVFQCIYRQVARCIFHASATAHDTIIIVSIIKKTNDGTNDTNDTMQYYDETYISDHQSTSSSTTRNKEKSILICGDGDLSFGASLAVRLANDKTKTTKEQMRLTDDHDDDGNVRLIVSVLDSEAQHSSGT